MSYWVLRDLSNGNGADGQKCPTYIWVMRTRAAARRKKQLHKKNAHFFSRLGPVERWKSLRGYRRITERGDEVYYGINA